MSAKAVSARAAIATALISTATGCHVHYHVHRCSSPEPQSVTTTPQQDAEPQQPAWPDALLDWLVDDLRQ